MRGMRVVSCLSHPFNRSGFPAADTRPIAEKTWTILKTLLFSTVMIADSCLSTFIYIPGKTAQRPSAFSADNLASDLAQTTLRTLSHLSFVISQFGGVSSSPENGFPQLKRVFYLSLDILAADHEASEKFIRQSCAFISGEGIFVTTSPLASPYFACRLIVWCYFS